MVAPWTRTGYPWVSGARFPHCIIASIGSMPARLWFLLRTNVPIIFIITYRPIGTFAEACVSWWSCGRQRFVYNILGSSALITILRISIKGELQRQNKLISSERPFKILQNETAKPFWRYSTLKIEIWAILRQKTTEKPKMLFF